LLDLQEVDSHIDQLDRRLKSLPERAKLDELTARRDDLETRHARARTEVDDIGLEQRKADNDVERVKDRRTRDRDRIDKGLVSSPKELEALQSEITSLDKRISDLEDTELEVMERFEDAESELSQLATQLAATSEGIAIQQAALESTSTEIGEQRSNSERERLSIAAQIPTDLLALYERLRPQFGGIAVGALQQGRCEACRLELTAADLSTLRAAPEDEVMRCEECQRILVRTPTSGL
jgi:predicted  nucleic acid-binding Zn-ribbon protein